MRDHGRTYGASMKKTLSTLDIARLLGVSVGSVANWIDREQLKAGRTPGGHRRVLAADLVAFLRKHDLPIPAQLSRPKHKVLVVDDEDAVRALIADEIKDEFPHCQVLQAHDGFSAGEIVGSMRPDVILLDLRMPGIDGFELCKRVKARKENKGISIIAMTAQLSPKAEKRILDCGATTCLSKPLDVALLMKEISTAFSLNGHRAQ